VRRYNMGQKQYSTKAKLGAKFQKALWRLEEVEREIREMEDGWGGSPLRVNPAQYEHDWVQFGNVGRARFRYAHLLEERDRLRELVATLRRKLEEVAG
jgi:hypothetical protein